MIRVLSMNSVVVLGLRHVSSVCFAYVWCVSGFRVVYVRVWNMCRVSLVCGWGLCFVAVFVFYSIYVVCVWCMCSVVCGKPVAHV